MEGKPLNMEQRKVLKNLFVTKLANKQDEVNKSLEQKRKDLITAQNKKLDARKEVKEINDLCKKLNEIAKKLKNEGLVIKKGEYDTFYTLNTDNRIRFDTYGSGKNKELSKLNAENNKKLGEINELEQEMIADIYSLNLEYTAMVELLNKKINKIMA